MTTLLLLLIHLLQGAGVPVQVDRSGHVSVGTPPRHGSPALREASPGGGLDLTEEFGGEPSDISNGF